MAASANPAAGGHSNGGNNNGSSNGGGPENANGGGGLSTTENSTVALVPTLRGLKHNPGISVDWTPEEQSTLDEMLVKYSSEFVALRYARIAQALTDKTARDVALRCRWMSKKETGKRRKDDNNSSRKTKEKKEKNTDSLPKSSQVANCSNGPPYLQTIDSDDGVPCKAIGGAVGQLLEQNAKDLDQIYSNFHTLKINENIPLLTRIRANINSLLNDLGDTPEIMKRMPPLSVKVNDKLADDLLIS